MIAIEEHALTPEAIERVVRFSETAADVNAERKKALDRERRTIDKSLANLTAAIETGNAPMTVLDRIRDLERKRRDVDAALASCVALPRRAPEVVADRLSEWRRPLRGSTDQARAVLQRVIDGRITFTPRPRVKGTCPEVEFEARTRFGRLFSGVCVKDGAVPEAFRDDEETLRASNLFLKEDADYGALLDRVFGTTSIPASVSNAKRVVTRAGIEPAAL